MVSFMHIAKNVKVTELSLYKDAILDACYQNISADDELWYHLVEVSSTAIDLHPKKLLSSNYDFLVIIFRFLFPLNLEISNSFYLYLGLWMSLFFYIKCPPHERVVSREILRNQIVVDILVLLQK
jgi:hypothetical protein